MLLSRDILPADGGRERLLLDAIHRFSTWADVFCFYFPNKAPSGKGVSVAAPPAPGGGALRAYRALRLPSPMELIWNLISRPGSLQESIFFSRRSLKDIKGFVRDNEIDAVYLDMVRLYRYAEPLSRMGIKIIYDLDDLLSARYARFSKNRREISDILGSYSIFARWKRISSHQLFTSVIGVVCAYEAFWCGKRELSIAKFSTLVLLTSPAERIAYIEMTRGKVPTLANFPIIPVRHGIDSIARPTNELVWLGNNNVPHNRAALIYLLEKILPDLKCFQLKVAGGCPDDLVLKYSELPGVKFLGYIENLDEAFSPGKIMAAPFLFGSGVKIKVLEAIASGVAVVTNEVGFQGIPYSNNKIFRPVSNVDEFREAIIRIGKESDFHAAWLTEQYETLRLHFSKGEDAEIERILADSFNDRDFES